MGSARHGGDAVYPACSGDCRRHSRCDGRMDRHHSVHSRTGGQGTAGAGYWRVSVVGAVVLAAGLARRMGQPKVLLEWESGSTILDHVLEQLRQVEIVIVVTGHEADKVNAITTRHDVTTVHNPDYATGEML